MLFTPTPSIHHGLLVPPSLAHLPEGDPLQQPLGCTVEQCLANRLRFPHTLLCGPADSGKRSLAALIAAEMGTSAHFVDVSSIVCAEELHAAFKVAPAGSVVVLAGMDAAHAAICRDIARAVARKRPAAVAHRPTDAWAAILDPEARASQSYADFTIIATTRASVDQAAPQFRWVERTYFVDRSIEGEAVRLSRLFRRVGIALTPAAIHNIAGFAVSFGIRTLAAASAILDWMRCEGLAAATDDQMAIIVPKLLAASCEPGALEEMAKSLAAAAAQDAASTNEESAPVTSKLILP
jgi:hypothetical protein